MGIAGCCVAISAINEML